MNLNKNLIIGVLAVSLVASLPLVSFAENQGFQKDNNVLNENFSEETPNGTAVNFSIDEGMTEYVDVNNIEEAMDSCDKLGKKEVEYVDVDNLSGENLHGTDDEKLLYVYNDGKYISVDANSDINADKASIVLKDIVHEAADNSEAVHLLEIRSVPQNELANKESTVDVIERDSIEAKGYGYVIRTGAAKKSGSRYVKERKTYLTLAKGKSITKTCTITSKLSISGQYQDYVALKSGFSTSYSETVSQTFDTKNMKPGTNCRKFKMKIIAQKYTREQKKINAKTNAVMKTTKAIIEKPVDFVDYSEDTKE